jgi:hypothetical protein
MSIEHSVIIDIPNLVHWFGTYPGELNPKFSPLPLGPKWNWKSTESYSKVEDFPKNIKIFDDACSKAKKFGNKNKSIFLYWNIDKNMTNNSKYANQHKNIRHTIFDKLQNNGLITTVNVRNKWEEYLSDLRNSIFCVSPPGNGTDAHRTWEALYMGCIPLVSSYKPLNDVYKNLPVIIVDDWSKLTTEYLKQKQQEIFLKNIHPLNLEQLNLDYWKNKIYNKIYNKMITYRGVIIEPRPHIALESVINNICEKIHCPITIVHGTKNKDYVLKIAKKIPCVDLVLEINAEQLNAKTYSKVLTTEEFWDKTRKNEQKILIFQTDSGICGEGNDIYNYLGYDYCGAPWVDDKRVGNGGFSIRDPEIAKKHIRSNVPDTSNEDLQFSKWCMEDTDCSICNYDTAIDFSSETIASKSWGFHNNFWMNSPICEFNKEVEQLNNKQPKFEYKIPFDNWKPTFTKTYSK